jgi:hypothetical protein
MRGFDQNVRGPKCASRSAMADPDTGVGNRSHRIKFRSRVHTPNPIRQTSVAWSQQNVGHDGFPIAQVCQSEAGGPVIWRQGSGSKGSREIFFDRPDFETN